jgi:hypothetical protein
MEDNEKYAEIFDKVIDNVDLSEEEGKIVEDLKKEELKTDTEKELYQLFNEEQGTVNDFSKKYFSNISEKNHVLAKLRYLELGDFQ